MPAKFAFSGRAAEASSEEHEAPSPWSRKDKSENGRGVKNLTMVPSFGGYKTEGLDG